MILGTLAILALAPEASKFNCPTELPPKAKKAKLLKGGNGSGYPEIAHQSGDETVRACVEVAVDGRVSSCFANGGSNERINQQSCNVIMHRFRYEPAKDRKRNPIRSFVIQKIIWKLPEE
jgi:periplasmic protein TonB